MTDFLIGRQQILDSNLETFAYEILFRGKDFDLNIKDGATNATNQVITDSILEIGLTEIVGPHKAFINFTSQNILEKTPLSLPKERIVIEVLENVTVDLRIIGNLRELSQQGYTIALDDFVLTPEWLPLLEFADIVKIDVMASSLDETRKLIEQLKPFKIKLLAEKVETHQEFELLKKWGCEFFQGFFFSKPNIVEGRRIGVNQTTALQLLAAVNKPDVSFSELNTIVSRDVGLSYKLLQYINSASFSLPNRVESIQQAITYLGLGEVRRWINILTLSSLSTKPQALLQNTLIRAKMCELLASEVKSDSAHLFLIGLLSGLDAILDMPMEKVLNQLPLSKEIAEAILDRSGIAGEILQYAIDYERWELNNGGFKDVAPARVATIYLECISWWSKSVLPCIN